MKKNILRILIGCLLPKACLYAINNQAQEIDLRLYEKRMISQNGEDGVLQKIFSLIGPTSQYYVEFGAGNGHSCSNTKYFREKYGWKGLLLEGSCQDNPTINLHQEFITAENICALFEKYNVPQEFDLISIDIDRNDFYVWKALSAHYKPRVVVIEFNPRFNYHEDKVIAYDAQSMWDHSPLFGAGILALFNLGRYLGYSLVYQESAGANLFFIRDDVLASSNVKFKNINDVSKLYTATPEAISVSKFVSSASILNSK